jgi:hypothetical protein
VHVSSGPPATLSRRSSGSKGARSEPRNPGPRFDVRVARSRSERMLFPGITDAGAKASVLFCAAFCSPTETELGYRSQGRVVRTELVWPLRRLSRSPDGPRSARMRRQLTVGNGSSWLHCRLCPRFPDRRRDGMRPTLGRRLYRRTVIQLEVPRHLATLAPGFLRKNNEQRSHHIAVTLTRRECHGPRIARQACDRDRR